MTYPGQSFGDPGVAQRTATVTLNADVSGYTNQMGAAAQQTGQLAGSVDALQNKISHLHSWAGRKLFSFARNDVAALGVATADAATFEKQLSTLSATAAVTHTSMNALKNGIESTFTALPVARGDIIALTEAITNMGVTGQAQVLSLTRTFLKLGAATGESAVGLAQGLIQLSRLAGVTDAKQIGNMANVLLTVSKNAGVSASGVLQFAQSIEPMARQAGIGEAKVLGISTAFSKAGQDGIVAGNSFNSMLSDISQLIATGSPELAKYSNLIGVTAGEFKKMDKATAFTEIVEALNRMGPKAIAVLDQLGLSGVRTQRAFAALSQSGDLQKQIAMATGAQNSQGNLNKGANAAFGSLADSLAGLRNQFTELGTIIGTTFLRPLQFAVKGVEHMTASMTSMMKPVSWLVATGGAAVGGVAALGGVATGAAGIIGAIALKNMITRGVWARGLKGGFAAERAEGDPSKLNDKNREALERYTGKQSTPIEGGMFVVGQGIARLGGPATDLSKLSEEERAAHVAYRGNKLPRAMHKAYSAGIGYGQVTRDGAEVTEAQQRRFAVVQAGLSPEQRTVYDQGAAYGRLPAPNALGQMSTWRNMGIAAPFRFVQWWNRGTSQLLRESTMDSYDRLREREKRPKVKFSDRVRGFGADVAGKAPLDVVGSESVSTLHSTGEVIGANVRAGAHQFGPVLGRLLRYGGPRAMISTVAGLTGVPLAGTMANNVAGSAGTGTLSEKTGELSRGFHTFGMALRAPIKTLGELKAATGEAARSAGQTAKALKDVALRGAALGLGSGFSAAGSGIARGASLAWMGAKQAASAAFSLPGMIALSAGTWLYGKMQDNAKAVPKAGEFINPIQKYNEMLGTTTANLATFSSALLAGADAAGHHSGAPVTNWAQAEHVGASDASNAPNKAVNPVFGDIKKRLKGKDAVPVLAGALGTMQMSDPQQLHAAVEDMFAAGFDTTTIQRVLNRYKKAGGPDPASGLNLGLTTGLGAIGANSVGRQYGNWLTGGYGQTKGTAHIMDTVLTGIDAQRNTDTQNVGGVYAQQVALKGYAAQLTPFLDKYQNAGSDAEGVGALQTLVKSIATITGGSEKTIKKYFASRDGQLKTRGVNGQRQIIKAIGSTKEGQRWLGALTADGAGGTIDPTQMDAAIGQLLLTPDASSTNGLLRSRGGKLGAFAADNKAVQFAIGSGQASPGAVHDSVEVLYQQAVKAGGGLGGAAAALSRFQAAVGTSTSALYQQVTAAQAMAVEESSFRAPFQTRGQNFGQLVSNYQSAHKAYYSTPKDQRTDDQYNFMHSQKQAYEQGLAEQQTYLQSMYQQALAYGTQMDRAHQDEHTQEVRAERNFGIQMDQMKKDFFRQQRRSQRDYITQTERANLDHNTALADQAKQAAQSIYDPFARIQSKYVIDGGTLSQNLGDQNAALAKQHAQLNKVKKIGLSQQAVQELNLADPGNAQQLNELVDDLTPAMARKLNAQVKTRLTNTTKLTQNPDNLAYQDSERDFRRQMERSSEDFHRSMDRATRDYQTAVSRAESQQSIAMGDMRQDFSRTIKRAGEDLNTAMTEVTGNFGSMYDRTMAQIAKSVEKFSPKAANQMRKDLKGLVADFPFLQYGNAASYNGSGAVTTPDTVGVNAKGQVGYYDAAGKFYTVKAAGMNEATLPQIAPPAAPGQPVQRGARGDGGVVPAGTIPLPQGHHHKRGGHKHSANAEGGITFGPQLSLVSEWATNAAEAHIPLNRGDTYFVPLANAVSRAMLQKMHTAGRGAMPSGGGGHYEIHEDHSTRFSGDMHIAAADLSDLMRQLKAKQRLARLSGPARR